MTARFRVEVLPTAAREFRRLAPNVQKRVAAALRQLEDDQRPGNSKKLRGGRNAYRLRLGEYRVLYEIDKARSVVPVIAIGRRRDSY